MPDVDRPDTRKPSREVLEREIAAGQRSIFHDILATYLGAAPDHQAILEQARKFPDRYAQGLTIIARLAGYSERREVTQTNLYADIGRMSDMELQIRIRECLDRLKVIDGTAQVLDASDDE